MALTFPLPLDQFFEGLRIVTAGLSLSDVTINSRTRGGEQLTAEIGNSLCTVKLI